MQKVTSVLFIAVIFLLIIGVSFLMLLKQSDLSESLDNIVMAEPLHHTSHTEDHAGLACCPCGTCHYKKENGEDEHFEIQNAGIIIRAMIVLLVITVWCSFLHL